MTDFAQKTAAPGLGGSGSGFAKATYYDIKWCVSQIDALQQAGGTVGGVWYWGHGIPQDSLGKDGDLYLNVDTADVYGKENGTWF